MAETPGTETIGTPSMHDAEGNGSGGAVPALKQEVQDVPVYAALYRLWAHRRRIALTVAVFVGIAVIYLLGTRTEYTTVARLMPEQQSESPNIAGLDLLQEFGGMMGGLSPGALLNQQNTLPVQIYPEILRSTPILLDLLRTPVPFEGGQIPLETYLTEEAPFSLWDEGRELLGGLTSSFRPELTPVVSADSSIIYLTRDRMGTVEDLQERLTVDLDKKTGILSITAEMPDPVVAASVGEAAVAALTDYLTQYRLTKLEQDLAFVTGRHEDARGRFHSALKELAVFQDRNQNLARNLALADAQRLQAEYDLAFNVYSSVAIKLEEAKIKVQEKTPIFQVLQPVSVPLEKSHPDTLLVLFLGLLGGLVAGIAIVLSGVDLERIKSTFRSSERS